MKKITIITLSFTLLIGFVATAQTSQSLSKVEKKKWKTEAKKFKKNPAALKSLFESESRLSSEADSLNSSIMELQSQLAKEQKAGLSEKQKTDAAKKETQQYKDQLAQSKNALDKYRDLELNCPEKMISGIVFRVQVGAYRKRDMSSAFNKNVNFGGEVQDGMQKYTVGQFRVKGDAEKFKSQLVEIGLVDAWIVTYQDGKRISSTKSDSLEN